MPDQLEQQPAAKTEETQAPPAASVFHHFGHALYFQRNNFFFMDVTARINRRMTLFTSYRINKDDGQGNQLSSPAGGTPITGGFIPPGGTAAVVANLGGTLDITSAPGQGTTVLLRIPVSQNPALPTS